MQTFIRPTQIYLRELVSVQDILKSRGFRIGKFGTNEDLLIPKFYWPSIESDLLFDCFDNAKNRKELLDLLNRQIDKPKNKQVEELQKISGFELDRKKYTTTFEWYIGELLVRKFSAFSYAYGIQVKRIKRNTTGTDSGDFDVLAVLRNTNLIYIECKSGKAQNLEKEHILKCTERGISLHCEMSIMVIDDVISEDHLKWALEGASHPLTNVNLLNKIQIKDNKESQVYDWMNCYFVSSKKNIEEQLRTVLRVSEAKKVADQYMTALDTETYSNFGYQIEELKRC